MSKPLRVLIVEDSDDDAQLLLRELKKGGFEPTHQRVETAEAMSAALEKQAWDVIISDYIMPRFSGPDALKLLQGKGLDLPFIIVSGKITEETAVAAMKAGAHDYLLKDRLARLCASVEQELRNAEVRREKKRAEKELKESEQEFRSVFDNAGDGILIADPETKKFVLGNNAVCRMFGYSPEEIVKLGVMDIHPEKDIPFVLDQFERQAKGEFSMSRDLPVKGKDGAVFYADVNATTITIAGKTHLMGFFHDTTERKRMEEDKIKQLEEFVSLATGRELAMIEREKEVNSLLKELGREPKYH